MNTEAPAATPAQQLASIFSGRVIEPTHDAYDTVRRVHNGLIDKRPALIATVKSEDIRRAARRVLREDAMTTVVVGKAPGAAE